MFNPLHWPIGSDGVPGTRVYKRQVIVAGYLIWKHTSNMLVGRRESLRTLVVRFQELIHG